MLDLIILTNLFASVLYVTVDTMPESRDRLPRPDEVRATFARQRQSIGGIAILLDEGQPEVGTPFRWGATAMTGTRGPMGVASTRGGRGVRRGSLGTPRSSTRNRRGQENMASGSFRRGRGRGRSTNSVLPSWYPRTPLRDVTYVVRVTTISLSLLHLI